MLTRSDPTTVVFDPGGPTPAGGSDSATGGSGALSDRAALIGSLGESRIPVVKTAVPLPGGSESTSAGDAGGSTTGPRLELDPGLTGPGTGGFVRGGDGATPPTLPEGVFVADDGPDALTALGFFPKGPVTNDVRFSSSAEVHPNGEAAAKAVRLQAESSGVRFYADGQLPIQHFTPEGSDKFLRFPMAGSFDRVGPARFYQGLKFASGFAATNRREPDSSNELGTRAGLGSPLGNRLSAVVLSESALDDGDDEALHVYARRRGLTGAGLYFDRACEALFRGLIPNEYLITLEAEGARRAAMVVPYFKLDRVNVPNCLAGEARCLLGGSDGHLTVRVNRDSPGASYTVLRLKGQGSSLNYAGFLASARVLVSPLLKAGAALTPALAVVSGLVSAVWVLAPTLGTDLPDTAAEVNVTSDFEIVPFDGETRSSNTRLRQSTSSRPENTPVGGATLDVTYNTPPVAVRVEQALNVFQTISLGACWSSDQLVDMFVSFSHEGYAKALEVAAEWIRPNESRCCARSRRDLSSSFGRVRTARFETPPPSPTDSRSPVRGRSGSRSMPRTAECQSWSGSQGRTRPRCGTIRPSTVRDRSRSARASRSSWWSRVPDPGPCGRPTRTRRAMSTSPMDPRSARPGVA